MSDNVIFVLIIAALMTAVGGAVYFVYLESQKPTLSLIKEDWECTKTETRTMLVPLIVGKTTIMQPRTDIVCIRYERK